MADPTSQALLLLCKELQALRDDVYNATLIEYGAAFALEVVTEGSALITTGYMPMSEVAPQTPLAQEIHTNHTRMPVVVYVRVEPNAVIVPPNGFTVDQSVLLLDLDKTKVVDPARASVAHVGYGDGITVLLPPGKTLYGSIMASADVTMSWRVIPLAGRSMVGVPA